MTHKLRYLTAICCLMLLAAGAMIATPQLMDRASAACSAMPTTLGTTTFTINVPANGTYRFWAHMHSPANGNDAFYMQVDQSYCQVTVGNTGIVAGQFKWVDYQNGQASNKINLSLSAGNHTFTLAGLDPSVGVDKIILAADSSCVPTGDGGNCTTTSSNPGPIITPPNFGGNNPPTPHHPYRAPFRCQERHRAV